MEFAGGGELFEYIVKQTRLEEQEARKLWIQTLEGVGYCHDRRIVHRDIKAGEFNAIKIFLVLMLSKKTSSWMSLCRPSKLEIGGSQPFANPMKK